MVTVSLRPYHKGLTLGALVSATTNQVYLAQSPETFAYDDDGNQTLITTKTGLWRVTYNGENRPIRWVRDSDNTALVMAYDHKGRRREKNAQRFFYDGYLQIANFHSQTPTQNSNYYIWDCTEPVATRPLAWFDSALDTPHPALYYAHDGNKKVSEVVAADGTLTAHYEYAPFGAVIFQRGESAASNPWRFSSEYADDELGCVYYNYREYEPVTGRWLQRDRIGEYGDLNGYAFVRNGVLYRIDRIGLITSAQFQGILEKLMACRGSDDVLNWDAAIEALHEQSFGKTWKKKILDLLKKSTEFADKIVDYGEIPIGAYHDVKEFLDWAYPDGAPGGLLEKLQGMQQIDYAKYLKGWDIAVDIANIASTLLSDESVTIDNYADFLDSWLSLSGLGDSLGGPIFMPYYKTLMDGIKEGVNNIVKKIGESEYQYFINQDCCQLEDGIYRNNFLSSIRSALSKPKENQKEMK